VTIVTIDGPSAATRSTAAQALREAFDGFEADGEAGPRC
jgi:cytidylate kinase